MKKEDLKSYNDRYFACPKEWKEIPVITGDYEMDAGIVYNHNADLPNRLRLYCNAGPYGQVTAYNGYGNYGGDS
jgi:hypothetical protein